MRKTKRLTKVTAGRLVFCVCYTQAMPSDSAKTRAEKTKCSSAARKRLNFVHSYEKLQLWLASNFTRSDLYVTLSYSDECLPPGRKAADKVLAKFLRRLGACRKAAGEELKYIKCTQELMDDGSRRLHHHLVINAGDERRDFDLIRSLWEHGDNIDISLVCNSEHYLHDDFLELAMYLARERSPDSPLTSVGRRSWSGSRNLKRWTRESEMVDESATVVAPPGAFILDSDEKQNEFGYFKFLKYLLPERKPPADRPPGGASGGLPGGPKGRPPDTR